MFSKKIAWLGLFAILSLSLHALASEPLSNTQILIDRAHYWAKLGRGDMAIQSWQALLQVDPENTEARAAIELYQAKNDTQPEANNVQPAVQIPDSTNVENNNPLISDALVPAQLSEPIAASEAAAQAVVATESAYAAASDAVVIPERAAVHASAAAPASELIKLPVTMHAELTHEVEVTRGVAVKKDVNVEDWADLYGKNPDYQADGSNEAVAVPKKNNEGLSGQLDSPLKSETTNDRASRSLMDKPSVSAVSESGTSGAGREISMPEKSVTNLQASSESRLDSVAAHETSSKREDAPELAPAGVMHTGINSQTGDLPQKNPQLEQPTNSLGPHADKSPVVPDGERANEGLSEPIAKVSGHDSAAYRHQVIQVEDWADLYPAAVSSESVDANVKIGSGVQNTDAVVLSERHDSTLNNEAIGEKPSLPAVLSVPVVVESRSAARPLAEQSDAESQKVNESVVAAPVRSFVPSATKEFAEVREKSGSVESGYAQKQTNQLTVKNSREVFSEASLDLNAGKGGGLTVNKTPTRLEMVERAEYWEGRGRKDIADKLRRQFAQSTLAQTDIRVVSQAVVSNQLIQPVITSAPLSQVAKQTSPATFSGSVVEQVIAPVVRNDYNNQPAAVAKTSSQELNKKAQYWESRGRSDLVTQVRQKLQVIEAGRGAGETESASREARPEVFRDDKARSALEDSLLKNPDSLKTRLDLAQIYRAAGENAKARIQIDSVLSNNPDLPDAIFASAQLYAHQRMWWETLNTLEKISPVARTTEMAGLQKTAWAHMQIDRADALVRQGKNLEAQLLLRRVAVELAVNYNEAALPEPPPLWKSETPRLNKTKR